MAHRFPFTKLAHNPTKPELVLSNGQHFLVLNTSSGELIKSHPEQDIKKDMSDLYRAIAFNKDGTLFTTTGEDKDIRVWETSDWSLKVSRPAHKRVNAIQFDNNSTKVLVADKFGDVYCHPMENAGAESEQLQPIVGHVSMVTDMVLTSDEKYVVTADRDEHIRVSRYPNGYNIESFCLGHTDVVTCISQLPWNEDILVSASGDVTVRLWHFVKGIQSQKIDLRDMIEAYKPAAADANSVDAIISGLEFDEKNKTLFVSFAKSTAILVLAWNGEGFDYKETLVAPAPILSMAIDTNGNVWASLDPLDDEKSDLVTVFIQNNGQIQLWFVKLKSSLISILFLDFVNSSIFLKILQKRMQNRIKRERHNNPSSPYLK
ncbi:WD40 repeat-like protein [Backusella circina FSU 941]|nr:WD40 repeat-like protein [Backusella circina FSU 941]